MKSVDSMFSKWIIERDGRCKRCGSTFNLTNSHFHGRTNSATRYDPLNNDAFCISCHRLWENQKKGAYKDFKLKQLGQKAYDELEARARSFMPRKIAIEKAMELMNKTC